MGVDGYGFFNGYRGASETYTHPGLKPCSSLRQLLKIRISKLQAAFPKRLHHSIAKSADMISSNPPNWAESFFKGSCA